MRIIQLTAALHGGGATNASGWLHGELLARGIDSRVWVGKADEPDERVDMIPPGKIFERLAWRVTQALGLSYVEIRSSFRLAVHPWINEQTVLHFHNLHGGHFNYRALPKLTARRPAVWTLHDMWGLTGHCVHSFECERWKTGCGRCPYPNTYPAVKRDLTHVEWLLKRNAYRNSQMLVASPSRWLADKARESILGKFPVHHIPNGIDANELRPLDKQASRRSLGLPDDRHVLLWCATRWDDQFKGGDLLKSILGHLPVALRREALLLSFGTGTNALARQVDIDSRSFGFLESDRLKALLYSSADLLLFSSRAENLPFVIMESLACGLPVVAFRIGGVPEMVLDGETGRVVPPFDTTAFAQAIIELLAAPAERERQSRAGRNLVEREFTVGRMAERYLALYRSVLGERRVEVTPNHHLIFGCRNDVPRLPR